MGQRRATGPGSPRRSRGAALTIDPATTLGAVSLTVADLDAQAAFYRDAIGLGEIRRDGDTVELGAPGDGAALVTLVGRPGAPPRPPRTTGLFHLALLVPTRAEYHHHLGLNTWAGPGAQPPPPGARGLRSFTIVLPDEAAHEATLAALMAAGLAMTEDGMGVSITDPSGNRAVLAAR